VRIAVIGDLMLDVLVEPDGPLRAGDDTRGRIRMEYGGQAANVAAWVAALGGQARLVCAHTGEDDGARAAARLRARGVEVVGPWVPGRGGVVVSIIGPGGQRSLVSDPGATRALRPAHLRGEWFAGYSWLHVSGYHLLDDDAAPAALHAADLARSHGARISLDLAYAARLRELGSDEVLRRVAGLGPSVVFQTEQEADALAGGAPAPVGVIKREADGCTVISGGESLSLPALEASVIDTTGAGDAFAAGFLMAGADDPLTAAEGGLAAAASCVAAVGAMPAPPVAVEIECP
jgi:sugar/nucleoside kinase (ribokinase family)